MGDHQQLLAWRVANQLAGELDRVTRLPAFRGAYRLGDQLRRASISTASNISEGHGRARRGEFAHFLSIARGSGVEVQSQLVLALDQRRLSYAEYSRLRGMADHAVALITKLRTSVLGQFDPELPILGRAFSPCLFPHGSRTPPREEARMQAQESRR